MNLFYIKNPTAAGNFYMIIDQKDIVRASGFGNLKELKSRLPKEFRTVALKKAPEHPYSALVTQYFNGDISALDSIPYSQIGSEFYKKIWRTMTNVKPGKTISYKQLAKQAGNPSAVRAAGTACGQNRLVLLVPCHRILKSDGSIGNYLYGSKIKSQLLQLERGFANRQGVV
jgi:methylated-DNA-[protein]-cysteine S-methyltransferase